MPTYTQPLRTRGDLVAEMADELGMNPDEIADAVDIACVTRQEWIKDPAGCLSRVRGALEEFGEGYLA